VLALAVAVGLQLLALVVVLVLVPTLSYLQPHFAGRYAAMIALGVHLDQFHGLFFQNPLLFAGLAGLPLFARQSPPLFALWALVYIAMLAPLCVYQFAYGGWSFAGRYGWDLAPLWIVPLGYCVRWLLQRRGGRPVLAAVLTAAAAVQVVFALEWIPTDGFLIQEMSRRPVWALDGFYRNLRGALPLFADPRDMLVYPPNWVWVWLTVLVVALCELWPKHRALLAGVWAATGLAVAIVFVLPRTERPFEIPGVLLAKSTGRDDGSARVAGEGLDAAGHLIASPHTWLRAGCYEVTLFYEASYPSAADSAVWESTGWTMLERGELPAAGPGSVFRHRLWVRPGERVANYQFRVWFSGAGQLRIEQLVIAQISCGFYFQPRSTSPSGSRVYRSPSARSVRRR
jgi:hypothetical protein